MSARHPVLELVAALAAGAAVSVAAAPATPPTPSLRIVRFSRHLEPTVRGAVGGSRATAPTGTRIVLGEEVALGWVIDVCHMQIVRIEVNGFGDQPAGPRNQERDGCYWLAGRLSVRPGATTVYRLGVSGTPAVGATSAPAPVSAQFEVQVAKPVLEAVEPLIDQASLRITFRARNRGEADLAPCRVNVNYSVRGVIRGPSPLINEGRLRAERVAIPRGGTVELGSVILPDKRVAFAYDDVTVGVRVDPEYTPDLEAATGSFPHRWTPRTMTLTSATLGIISRASRCRIRLNNYDPAARPVPIARNDSSVSLNIAGTESTNRFDLPSTNAVLRATGSLSGHTYVEKVYPILINQIVTDLRNRDDFFSIREGRLVIHLEFPNAGGPEVKIGELADGAFRDDEAPDVNIGPFIADILLTPGVTSDMARLTFVRSSVEVPPVSARLEGRFEWLNTFVRGALNTYVHDTIVDQLNGILTRAEIRRAFENGLTGITSGLDVTVIRRVEGRGTSIVMTYL